MTAHTFWITSFLVLVPMTAQAQSFTSISVKLAASCSAESRRVKVLPNGDVLATSINPASLLGFAYDVPTNPSERLFQLQEWTVTQRYDITARTAGKTQISSAEAVRGKTAKDEFRLILKERFHLSMRTERDGCPLMRWSSLPVEQS